MSIQPDYFPKKTCFKCCCWPCRPVCKREKPCKPKPICHKNPCVAWPAEGAGDWGGQNGWVQDSQNGWGQSGQNGWAQDSQNGWAQDGQNGWEQYNQGDGWPQQNGWAQYPQNGWGSDAGQADAPENDAAADTGAGFMSQLRQNIMDQMGQLGLAGDFSPGELTAALGGLGENELLGLYGLLGLLGLYVLLGFLSTQRDAICAE